MFTILHKKDRTEKKGAKRPLNTCTTLSLQTVLVTRLGSIFPCMIHAAATSSIAIDMPTCLFSYI